MPDTTALTHLKDLWDERDRRSACREPAVPASLSLQSPRGGPAHHELRRRQYELEDRSAGSVYGSAGPRARRERQRRRSWLDHRRGVRAALSRQAGTAESALPRRSLRRRDGGILSARRIRPEPGRRVDRYAAPRVSARAARRPSASRTGRSRWPHRRTANRSSRNSIAGSAGASSGCRGSGPGSSSRSSSNRPSGTTRARMD